jgi:hypothetical protein
MLGGKVFPHVGHSHMTAAMHNAVKSWEGILLGENISAMQKGYTKGEKICGGSSS